MTPDIIELFKSVCEKMRKADYVEARSDMLQALERFEHSKPQNINWIKCSDRLPEINVESIEMSGARAMNNLKKLDQSVFDGLRPEYKFAAVDANGWAFAYEQRPYVEGIDGFNCSRWIQRIPGKFDATDWQNSLIEREEEEAGANTKRTVLCVNACEGFSNEDLEGTNLFNDYLKSLREIVTQAKQRDKLLAELKATESRLHEVSTFCATVEQQRDELLNILQRLEEVDFGEHWNSGAEQAAVAARALIRKF